MIKERSRVYRHIFILLLVSGLWLSCNNKTKSPKIFAIDGETMGTYYRVSYVALDSIKNLKWDVDSVLEAFNKSLSTYRADSRISAINRGETLELDELISHCLSRSLELCSLSGGDFDITVAPVVNAYGFGFKKMGEVNDSLINALMENVGCQLVSIDGSNLVKARPGVMFDFNALAPGYAVDILGQLMSSKGQSNWLIDIGGELKAKGLNAEAKAWRIEIETPEINSNRNRGRAIVSISDRALATSGNYRKTYIKDGIQYAHTINPKSGKPALNDLLSATIIADDTELADALATTCMVKGLSGAIQFMNEIEDTEWYFIYRNRQGNMADTFSSCLAKSIMLID